MSGAGKARSATLAAGSGGGVTVGAGPEAHAGAATWETPEQAAMRLGRLSCSKMCVQEAAVLRAIRERDAQWKAALETEAKRLDAEERASSTYGGKHRASGGASALRGIVFKIGDAP